MRESRRFFWIWTVFFLLLPTLVAAEAGENVEETPISTEEGGGNPGVPDVWFCMKNSDGRGDKPEKMSPTDFEKYGTIGDDGKAATVDPSIGYLLPCREATIEPTLVEETVVPTPTVEPTIPVITEEPITPPATEVLATEVPATEAPAEPTDPATEEPAMETSEVEVPVTQESTEYPVVIETPVMEISETEEPVAPTETSDGTGGSEESAEESIVSVPAPVMVAIGEWIARSATAAANTALEDAA